MATNTTGTIVLDRTLRDLYATDNDNEAEPQPTLVYCPVQSTKYASFAGKYVYHYGARTADTAINANTWMTLALKILPQRYGFLAGKLSVVVVDLNSPEPELRKVEVDYSEAHLTFAQLRHDQQPAVSYTTDPSRISLNPGSRIVVAMPSDYVAHLPHLVDPDIHYDLLSKRGLALSGLPTPPSSVIDQRLKPEDSNTAQIEREAARMVASLDRPVVPFVVKLNQSISGRGVFVVTSEADRIKVKEVLNTQLQGMLSQSNGANIHLNTCSLVVQDYIPAKAVGLSLFVTKKGRPIFIACCEQQLNDRKHWVGGSISYPDQPALKRKFEELMNKTALFLHQRGYYGPVGLDVITGTSGEQYIVDLNARVSGTYHLGLLAGHFARRGIDTAVVLLEYFSCSRPIFEAAFACEIQRGSIIVGGWTHDEPTQLSYGFITIGGEGSLGVESLLRRVQAHLLHSIIRN